MAKKTAAKKSGAKKKVRQKYLPPEPNPRNIGCVKIEVTVLEPDGSVAKGCRAKAVRGGVVLDEQDLDLSNVLCVRQTFAGSVVEAWRKGPSGTAFYGYILFNSGFQKDEKVSFVLTDCECGKPC